jgi:triosephosphate isomerase (TIM)
MEKKLLIAGNWKMHGTVPEALLLLSELQQLTKEVYDVDIVVCPPFTALYSAAVTLQDTPILLGAQNMHWENEGAFTGEIAGNFIKDIGCTYVLIGHSERRHIFGETDDMLNKKVQAALGCELIPIFCVGETESQRDSKQTFSVIEKQLKVGLRDLRMNDLKNFAIAYEPFWAIGTGKTATPDQVAEVHSFIRNTLAKTYDAPTASGIRLLYGGSVKPNNAAELKKTKDVDGLLIGGASLKADQFSEIIKN